MCRRMALTAKELSAVEEQLKWEQLAIVKCKVYAGLCGDPQLKQKCETIAGKHITHYERLMSLLNQS